MNIYECINCHQLFFSFPEANEHEKHLNYAHLTISLTYETSITELIVCACGCGEVAHAVEAIWAENQPYVPGHTRVTA